MGLRASRGDTDPIGSGPGLLLAWQLRLHDLDAASAGYSPWLGIGFISGEVLAWPGQRRADLLALRIIDVLSLRPLTAFGGGPSWSLSSGWYQAQGVDGGVERRFGISGGMGATVSVWNDKVVAYALLGGALSVGAIGDGRAEAGPGLHLLLRPHPSLSLGLHGEDSEGVEAAARLSAVTGRSTAVVTLTADWELRLEWSSKRWRISHGALRDGRSATVLLNRYF